MEGAVVMDRLAAIDIRAGEGPLALARRKFRPDLVVQPGFCRRFEAGDRNGDVGHAGRPEGNAVILEADLVRAKAKRRADHFRVGCEFQPLRQFRQIEFSEGGAVMRADRAAHRADILLQHEHARRLACQIGKRDRRTNRRMPRERHLIVGREDANPIAVLGIFGRQHENRLG